jgi:hypothetical protein
MVFSTNKTDRHDITEILLKVALNTITPTPLTQFKKYYRLLIKCSIRYLKIVIIFYTWSFIYQKGMDYRVYVNIN